MIVIELANCDFGDVALLLAQKGIGFRFVPSSLRLPINEEPVNEEPVNEEPVNEEPVNEEPVNDRNIANPLVTIAMLCKQFGLSPATMGLILNVLNVIPVVVRQNCRFYDNSVIEIVRIRIQQVKNFRSKNQCNRLDNPDRFLSAFDIASLLNVSVKRVSSVLKYSLIEPVGWCLVRGFCRYFYADNAVKIVESVLK